MDIKKITAVICSGALFTACFNISAGAEEETEPITIMAVGDSITDGYGTEGSYRKFLYHELEQSGYSVDMVGPNASWGDGQYTSSDGETFIYDASHCGFSGYAIEEYPGRNGILETIRTGNYLSEYRPDIVILQIGTNDIIDNHEIDTAGERLDTLVTYILDNISDDSALFVTTIPELEPNRAGVYDWFSNYRHSADWQTSYSDEEAAASVSAQIENYNTQVKKLVSAKQDEGISNIYFGDIHSTITDTAAQLGDGVHPNNYGYYEMGQYWTGILLDYLGGNNHTPPVTEPEPSVIPGLLYGDVNPDYKLDSLDIVLLQQYLLGTAEKINYQYSDLDGNGTVNIADLILLKRDILAA